MISQDASRGPKEIGIGSIAGPKDTPPDKPDDITSKEISQACRLAKLKPTERYVHETERQLAFFCSERSTLMTQNEQLSRDLSGLRPAHAALKEAYKGSVAYGALATGTATTGGVLLSIAQILDTPQVEWRMGLVGAGIASTALSLAVGGLGIVRRFISDHAATK